MSFSFCLPVGFADIPRHSRSFVKVHSHGQSSFLFSMRSAHQLMLHIEITSVKSSQDDQSPLNIRIMNEDLCSLMGVDEFTKSALSSDGVNT